MNGTKGSSKLDRSVRSTGVAFSLALLAIAEPAHAQSQIVAFEHAVSSVVTSALKTPITLDQFIAGSSALLTKDNINTVGCDIANFGIGYLIPAGPPTPMNVCGQIGAGAGYYLMGDTGPGGLKPFNKITAFLPTTDRGCTTRQYNFKFAITGANKLTSYANTGSGWFEKGVTTGWFNKNSGAGAANEAWKALYKEVGDFAVLASINPSTGWITIYVMASDASKITTLMNLYKNAQTQSTVFGDVVKTTTNVINIATAGPSGRGLKFWSEIRTGASIDESFAGLCNSPIFFWYLAGTASVYLG